jgi:hypothetical protein
MWKNAKRIEWSGHGFRVGKTGQRVRLYMRLQLWLCWLDSWGGLVTAQTTKLLRSSVCLRDKSTVTDELFNLLNAELNPICHLLILLGDLTFMGKCIVSILNKIQRYTVYFYLETALNVSGGTSTHHQERIQLYPQHLVFVTPLLLSAAIVEELEPVWVCCGWRTRCCGYSCMRSWWWVEVPPETCRAVSRYK